jgi:2-amino-4-hydroxy-6-hydroxymethyldihydropteridine diphosphokinase
MSSPASIGNFSQSSQQGGALVVVALGSNLADPAAAVRLACSVVVSALGLRGAWGSSLWQTQPAEAASGAPFVNAVLCGSTGLTAPVVLQTLHGLERAWGRDRATEGHHGSRPLDLDLLDHGGQEMDLASLQLPHPRLHTRGFVLGPLAEAWPQWQHPRLGRTALALWQAHQLAHGHNIAETPLWPSPLPVRQTTERLPG